MASSKHTTTYQLNQWLASDPVLREDFNSDNLKLENALAALAAALNTKAGSDQLTAVAQTVPKVAVGSYVGDGAASKSIALPFTPKAVYACPSTAAPCGSPRARATAPPIPTAAWPSLAKTP